MFIKKDTRSVEQILADEADSRTTVILTKRFSEFQGSTKILCREINIPALQNLRVLNLYDNGLSNLHGIGLLAETPIEEINLGANKLSSLPSEFGQLSTLQTLWLEDNCFESFPTSICRLHGLRSLRLSGNSIANVPELIMELKNLENLALDNNELTEISEFILQLKKLKKLWLRQNQIAAIPEDVDSLVNLEILSVSSNQIQALPATISSIPRLRSLYANGNKITGIPSSIISSSLALEELNLANNRIEVLFDGFVKESWLFDEATSTLSCKGDKKMVINLSANPVLQIISAGLD